MGLLATGTMGFGIDIVRGLSRVPNPPAIITALRIGTKISPRHPTKFRFYSVLVNAAGKGSKTAGL